MTTVIAVPVLRAPSDRVFGQEIVGRHHDPFTVMEQFTRPIAVGIYTQPVTDIPGALLSRVIGPVAAYNWLVLMSFPLSAAAAYLLARFLALSPAGAAVAGAAFAFSPFHFAHAAYHPHIAQVQWVPLYFLALWRCIDRASPAAVAVFGLAAIGVALSNFYGGFIVMTVTPVAVVAYWIATRDIRPRPARRLAVAVGSLALIGMAGLAYASFAAEAVVRTRAAFGFPRSDLFLYSAKSWSYLVPPVEHPVLGATALRIWRGGDVREGLLEQQVSLGWGIIALALVAIGWWLSGDRRTPSRRYIPALAIVAFTALLCSLSPEWQLGSYSFSRPSAWLYPLAPMFRAYARFGVIVQLMAVLLAGIGVTMLLGARTKRATIACIILLVLAASEYAVSPSAQWRDVLPSAAHRWVMQQPGRIHVLDCTPPTPASASVAWLSSGRITPLGTQFSDCGEPHLDGKLAALGYTHMLVDAEVLPVTAAVPPIYTAAMAGFSPREYGEGRSWRWMGQDTVWSIINTGRAPLLATLELELSAFHHVRRMELRLDGQPLQAISVEPERRLHEIGPFVVPPGAHELAFHSADSPTPASTVLANGDTRSLSFAFGVWHWHAQRDSK